MPGVSAIIFDLYGTLLRIGRPVFHRTLPRALGVRVRPWMRLVRGHLLTSQFRDRLEFVRFICKALRPGSTRDTERMCTSLLEAELASIEPYPGIFPVLRFLKRRGYALGLISNLTSVHKEPAERLGLLEHFDAVAFSCDLGICKPDPAIYVTLCQLLEVEPGSVLLVGDSVVNDVRAARAVGMRALRVGRRTAESVVGSVGEFGWMHLDNGERMTPLLKAGDAIGVGRSTVLLDEVVPVPDERQGRYNLVASARGREIGDVGGAPASSRRELICKRYLFPEAAYVEEFAHSLMAALGFNRDVEATVAPGPEPWLVMSKVAGSKLGPRPDRAVAFEVGRHFAAAYVLSNADWRPRNAFVSYEAGRPTVTMVDLEHMFFNLALDLTGLDDRFRPETFDRLSEPEISGRLRRRVITEKTIRRAVRTFIDPGTAEADVARAFRDGCLAAYRAIKARSDWLCRRIEERIYTEPFLIIGTRAYRRAMARLDVEDIRRRIGEDPGAVCPRFAALGTAS